MSDNARDDQAPAAYEPCGRALLPDPHAGHEYSTGGLSPRWVYCSGDYRRDDKRSEVTVPRWAAEMLLGDPLAQSCAVCRGGAPSSDGHDQNPPCIGYARQIVREAL